MSFSRAFTHFLAFVLFLGASWAPAQDRAYNALSLLTGTTIGNNLGATNNGSDPSNQVCSGFNDVWYSYVAGCNGVVTVDTCGAATNFDTTLGVYDGTCGPNSLILLNCNDDFCSSKSRLTFIATQGMTYFIRVAGYNYAVGTFALTVSCLPGIPPNDDCAGGPLLRIGDRIVANNFGATTSAGLSCNAFADVWYRIFLPSSVSGNVTISTCNADVGGVSNLDTVLNVFQGACGSLSYVGCNDDACGGLQSTFTFAATAGNDYWVSVGGYGGATGRFGLKVSQDNDLAFRFWDQGPGTIGFRVSGAAGYYYFFGTTHAGAYPNGFFYGIDISIADIFYELGVGPPFTGPMTVCGTVGPFGPLPPGLTIYGVALGTPTAGGYPTAVSAPASYTIL